LTTNILDLQLCQTLENIFDDGNTLFPSTIIKTKEDIADSYQVFRSLRRSSTTRALEQNISESDIYTVNRWHNVDQAQGNRPSRQMHQHYAQPQLQVAPYVRYTHAM
jgi:hypothetical protein